MIHVRRHVRITASGKRASVRAHERAGDDGLRPVPEEYRPPYVGDLTPVAAAAVDEDWWDDDDQAARDAVTYGEPVDKTDITAWVTEMAARDAAAQADMPDA